MIRPLLLCSALLLATPALAASPLKDVLARLGQGELVASDGPSYRAIVGGAEVMRLQVAGDGRATLTMTDKTGKTDSGFFTNRQLDALDAALGEARLNGETMAVPEGCKPETGIIFETLAEGRYRYGVECGGGPLAKAVEILRGR
jgi:hypothetical protein